MAKAPDKKAPLKLVETDVTFVEATASSGESFEYEDPDFEGSPTSLAPTAVWEKPGNRFIGTYLGMKVHVGTNKSRIYSFKAPDGAVVGIWGTTVLDDRFDRALVDPGDEVKIVFLGEGEKKKGQNAPRVFWVGVKKRRK